MTMRILSARITGVRVNRILRRIDAVVVLRVGQTGGIDLHCRVPTSAPITAPGAAPLKTRLIASAKLIFAMSATTVPVEEADLTRDAA